MSWGVGRFQFYKFLDFTISRFEKITCALKNPCAAAMPTDEEAHQHTHKPIPGHSRYECCKCGEIRNVETNHVLKHYHQGSFYPTTTIISDEGYKGRHLVLILVIDTWTEKKPCPRDDYIVNHKDGNKQNCEFSNLEYCTLSYNARHARDHGLVKTWSKQVAMLDAETNIVLQTFPSMKACLEALKLSRCKLAECIRKHKLFKGCYFEFVGSAHELANVLPGEKWRPVVTSDPSIDKATYTDQSGTTVPAYECSSFGRFRSNRTGIILRQHKDDLGYLTITFCVEGQASWFLSHRVLCRSFHANPRNLPYVDHIDRNRSNNIADNLRWVTAQENAVYAIGVPIDAYNISGQFIEHLESEVQAAEKYDTQFSVVSDIARGRAHHIAVRKSIVFRRCVHASAAECLLAQTSGNSKPIDIPTDKRFRAVDSYIPRNDGTAQFEGHWPNARDAMRHLKGLGLTASEDASEIAKVCSGKTPRCHGRVWRPCTHKTEAECKMWHALETHSVIKVRDPGVLNRTTSKCPCIDEYDFQTRQYVRHWSTRRETCEQLKIDESELSKMLRGQRQYIGVRTSKPGAAQVRVRRIFQMCPHWDEDECRSAHPAE